MADKKSNSPEYPPYHPGEHFTCPKCSSRDKKVVHCYGRVEHVAASSTRPGYDKYHCPHEWEGEHMHLQCARCGYTVPREPMDSYVKREGIMPNPHRPDSLVSRSGSAESNIEAWYSGQISLARHEEKKREPED